MRVFVTGATGYIGTAVSEALAAAGHQVIGLARSDASAEQLRGQGAEVRRGELSDEATLRNAAAAADATIHLAATGDARTGELDRAAVAAILDALRGSGKSFVYTSGVWVMPETPEGPADEDTPLDPAPLVAWRPAVEELALAAAGDGVRSVVVRPAMVYGRGGGIVAMLVRSARDDGAARMVGDGGNRWSFVHVDDLADLYVQVVEEPPAGEVLLAASGEPRRVREVAEAASQSGGAGGEVEAVPLEQARQKLGAVADALSRDQWVVGDRARERLGWRPHRPDVIEELKQGSYAVAGR